MFNTHTTETHHYSPWPQEKKYMKKKKRTQKKKRLLRFAPA